MDACLQRAVLLTVRGIVSAADGAHDAAGVLWGTHSNMLACTVACQSSASDAGPAMVAAGDADEVCVRM